MVDVYFAGKTNEVKLPSKKTEDAGYDIYAFFEEDYIVILPHKTEMIPTGLYSACDNGYFFRLAERGSTGTKGIGQRAGIIDSGYRGEWFVPLTNHNDKAIVIAKKKFLEQENDPYYVATELWWVKNEYDEPIFYPYEKAICQALVLPVPQTDVHYIAYDELASIESERGCGALGSSQK